MTVSQFKCKMQTYPYVKRGEDVAVTPLMQPLRFAFELCI